ncbi:hypothetical protein FACS1894158_01050 [Betaproteobacteria bacterium]|nr:hypothetical protein FACS1894158_01050 [Betaproteobacteria bacterium]
MAKYIEGQHIRNLPKEQLVFWTKGNEPTQKVNNLTYNIVLNNLKLLYLLSGKIIASASYFFESTITQQVTDSLKSFFEEGDISFFFDDDLDSPTEHAEKKISKSPKGLSVYRDKKTVLINARKLEIFGNNLLRRPPLSISSKMVELWIQEVLSTTSNSIGANIAREVRNYAKQNEIKNKLVSFATNRDKDFVWDYIKPILVSFGLKNPDFHKMIQRKLSQMYSLATANVLGVELDEKLNYNLIDKNSKYDTTLFKACLCQLGIYELILQLDNDDLKQLKNSIDFAIFRDFYFKTIEDCEYRPERIKVGIDTFSKIEGAKQNNISRKEFINKFVEYNKLCNYPRRAFKKRLDEIKTNLENFNIGTGIVNNFVSLVQSKHTDNTANKDLINENVNLKLKEYNTNAIKKICWYSLFIGIAIFIFLFGISDEKLNETIIYDIKWKHIKQSFSLILFLFPFIRSFIKHDDIIKSFLFLFSKKEKARIKAEFEKR